MVTVMMGDEVPEHTTVTGRVEVVAIGVVVCDIMKTLQRKTTIIMSQQ